MAKMENELEVVSRFMAKAPVDIKGVFDALGIEYRTLPLGKKSAWIERNGDCFVVVVNELESEMRQRFSAAHELAHYLLHRDMLEDGCRVHRHEDRLFDDEANIHPSPFEAVHEVQANRLAAQIIMPASLVRHEWAKCNNVTEMAQAFRVSKVAMEIRLKNLGVAV